MHERKMYIFRKMCLWFFVDSLFYGHDRFMSVRALFFSFHYCEEAKQSNAKRKRNHVYHVGNG